MQATVTRACFPLTASSQPLSEATDWAGQTIDPTQRGTSYVLKLTQEIFETKALSIFYLIPVLPFGSAVPSPCKHYL